MQIGTWAVSERVAPLGWLKSLKWRQFSGVPAANHLALSGSGSIFVLTKGPPLCSCSSFSQVGFQCEGVWEVNKTCDGLLFAPLRNPPVPIWSGRSPWPSEWEIGGLFIYSLYRAYPSLFLLVLLSWSIYRRQSQAACHSCYNLCLKA